MKEKVLIRPAVKGDVPVIMQLIIELAAYQHGEEHVSIDEARLLADGFGDQPDFEVILAELDDKVVAMAFYYTKYSTWKGRMLYLEDLYVQEAYRSFGVGGLLLDELESIAAIKQCAALSWQVIDWNDAAIRFYERRGCTISKEWLNCYQEVDRSV